MLLRVGSKQDPHLCPGLLQEQRNDRTPDRASGASDKNRLHAGASSSRRVLPEARTVAMDFSAYKASMIRRYLASTTCRRTLRLVVSSPSPTESGLGKIANCSTCSCRGSS